MTSVFSDHPIEGILFDYGYTLMTFSRPQQSLDAAFSDIATLLSVDPQIPRNVADCIETFLSENAKSEREVDVLTLQREEYARQGVVLTHNVQDEIVALEQVAWWDGIFIGPDVTATLDELRECGIRVGLCSNSPYPTSSMVAQLQHFDLFSRLDSVTFSSAVGWRKPSLKIFNAALEALGTTAGKTVFVGDRMREDIAGARAVGMHAIRTRQYYDDPLQGKPADSVIENLADLVELFVSST